MAATTSPLPPLAVLAGVRTPFAKAFGALADVPADQLGRVAVEGVLPRAGVRPADVNEVIFGNIAGPPDAANISRVIALRAGIPNDRIAHTVGRNCASGIDAVVSAWHSLAEGRSETIVAGGTESMTNIPFLWDDRAKDLLVEFKRAGFWRKLALLGKLRPRMLRPVVALEKGLTDPICGLNMGETAEVLAKEFGIGRDEQDRFALESQHKAEAGQPRRAEEIFEVKTSDGAISRDEHPRPATTMESLAKLPPVFREDGSVTAGNSSGITDGAAAMVLMSESRSRVESREPLARVLGWSWAGVPPEIMGIGPVPATLRVLERTGLALPDIDLIEINEAFAAQVIACERELKFDRDRVNRNGGGISLGHPIGMSGARILLSLAYQMRDQGASLGLATLCISGGQGLAVVLERI